ncbi:MAG: efflux transporter outer membrane subunit [Kiritimatiellae bacterium]|nr:efflux transporter outer membrane subunit [Kiritimatiellia bacterium]MDD4341514.1 efflux transporter outer membrane subunit [Kiritimatiellia bacterium]
MSKNENGALAILGLKASGVLVWGWLLAGCLSVGPDYQAPEMAVPEAWQGATGDSSDTMAQWWTVFGDAALETLVAEARANNRDLAAAVARMDSTAAALGMARAAYFPSVGMQGAVEYDRQSERVHTPTEYEATDNPAWLTQAGFSMSWELDLWGRVRRSVEAARGALDASQEDVRNVQVMLQAQVAAVYIQLRTLQKQVVFAERNIELQQDTLTVVRGRFEAGLTGELDVRQAEMNLAATTAGVPLLKAGIEQALNGLCQLTGRLPGEWDELRSAGPVPTVMALPGGLPAELLRRRPDIRSAERRLAAQTAKIGVAQADFFPHLALNGTLAVAATDAGELGKKASQNYRIGPSLTWAIFTAGKVRNRVRAEEAATRAALADYEQTVLGAYRECEDALAALANEGERLTALGGAVTAAEQTTELVAELYRTGLTDFQGVLDAQRQLAQYQDALAQSMGKSAAELVAAYKAFGGGWAVEDGAAQPAPPLEAEKNGTDLETPGA